LTEAERGFRNPDSCVAEELQLASHSAAPNHTDDLLDDGTISTPLMPPDRGTRSRVRKPRSTPINGPKSTLLRGRVDPDFRGAPSGRPDCVCARSCSSSDFSQVEVDGGDGAGVSGVSRSTNSAMRVRAQSRAAAPQAQVVNVEASACSIEDIWCRMKRS